MRVDVGQAHLDVGDPVRIVGGLGFAPAARRARVGGQHDLDQAFRPAGRFLREAADAPRGGNVTMPVPIGGFAADGRNSVDLPVPLRPTKPTRAPGAICTVACRSAGGPRSGPRGR